MKRAKPLELPPSKKRAVTVKTVEKWIAENDKELDTATWLKFEKGANRQYVASLKCLVCSKYEDRLYGCRHFNPAFILGSSNLRCSSFKDHAVTEMHMKAMKLFQQAEAKDRDEYYQQHAPIARALLSIDSETGNPQEKV